MDTTVFRHFREADWEAIGKRLLAHAIARASYYHWRDGAEVQLAVGQTLEDIVQDVIYRTISGQRRWDPAKGALEPWLLDQVNSLMDHLAKSAANKYETHRLYEFDDAPVQTSDGEERMHALPAAARADSAEDVVLRNEDSSDGIGLLIDAAYGDAELMRLLEHIVELESAKPAELAVSMGTSVGHVYDLMRKLKRRVERRQGAHEAVQKG